MKYFIYYIIFLLVTTCPVTGQAQSEGYQRLVNDAVSSSGRIVTYVVQSDRIPVLFAEDLKASKTYRMENVARSEAVTDRYIVGLDRTERNCFITDVVRGITQKLTDTDEVHWIDNYQKVLVYDRRLKVLRLCSADGKQQQTFKNVSYYKLSADNLKVLLVINDGQIHYLSLGSSKSHQYTVPLNHRVKAALWDNENKKAIVFSVAKDSFYLSMYNEKCGSIFFKGTVFDSKNNTLTDTLFRKIRLLDNNRIALGVYVKQHSAAHTGKAEIWLGSSKGITPNVTSDKKKALQIAVIDMDKAKWLNVSDPIKWMDYRFDYNDRLYSFEVNELEDFKNQYPDRNLAVYSKDYEQLEKSLRIAGSDNTVFDMPGLNGLLFFNGKNWSRYYRVRQVDKVVAVTEGVDDLFYNADSELYLISNAQTRQSFPVYKDSNVIFHGYHDLWFYNINTRSFMRKTNGKEQRRRYQVEACNYTAENKMWSWGMLRKLDRYSDMVLSWYNPENNREGIALFDKAGRTRTILEDSVRYTQILRAPKYITYVKEKASNPPALFVYDIVSGKERLLFQSNLHDKQAENLRSSYIKWDNGNGGKSGAIVRYPFNYDPSVKYPAIVSIYEKKSRQQHVYTSPFEKIGSSINYRDYVSRGYFVIEPDIDYVIGMPGYSATNSVQMALDTLSGKLSLDMDRLGLIGHSFGGYQTNFIITQTKRFKAAVSSSGVSDLTTRYLTYSKEYKKPDMWRMESWQVRMGKSLFEDYDGYISNSPVFQSHKVTTPLLLVTGREDKVVEADQSVAMFLALKRQSKIVNLLMYPQEEHVIMNQENILDASKKISSWFDYYLKDMEEPQWLKE